MKRKNIQIVKMSGDMAVFIAAKLRSFQKRSGVSAVVIQKGEFVAMTGNRTSFGDGLHSRPL